MTGKYVQPREVNRAVFGLIYRCRYACREQITLAIRGRRRANDRYIHRCLRKMETLGILSAHRQSLLSKKIYCLARRNAEGRRLALAVFGEDRRAVSGRLDAQIDHSLFLTWVYVYFQVASRHQNYSFTYLDRFDMAWPGRHLVPDGVILIEKQVGRRAFLIEYQRSHPVALAVRQKLDAYQTAIATLASDLRAERAWVLFIVDKPNNWLADFVGHLAHSGLFLFTSREMFLAAEPATLWTTSIWFEAGVSEPVPIFLPPA